MESYEKKHLEMLRKGLGECTVLLKKDGTFPLPSPCTIALFGNGARHTVKGGTGSGEVNSRFFVTVEEGLKNAGFTLTTEAWLDGYDEELKKAKASFYREIRARARKKHKLAAVEGMGAVMPEPEYDLPLTGEGEAALYVLARSFGEGSDRNPVGGDILLSESEKRDILALNEKFERFMLVLNTGGPVDLSPVAEVGNILLLSQLGVETGSVLADLLLGKTCPSGRLTATWAAFSDYPQIGEFGNKDDTCYREGIYTGYRWFDLAEKQPLFPFGYGLGYADFETEVTDADQESVTVRVKNTGAFPGKETVQIYIAPPREGLDKPLRVLAAFRKTGELKPGESETLRIPFSLEEAASWDGTAGERVLEAGEYTVTAGTEPAVTLNLKERAILFRGKARLGDPGFADWKPEAVPGVPQAERKTDVTEGFRRRSSDGETAEAQEDVNALSDEELARLAVGAFDAKGTVVASVIGNSALTVAGAAGESCTLGGKYPSLVMADGPAGLRLSRNYYRDAKGVHGTDSTMPENVVTLLPGPVRFLMKRLTGRVRKGVEIHHQYCTALPIGTAIAQSWNPAFAEICGEIVGDEMERFGVQLWLAPALNIQRNIRCGRNFEYFSEDPLLSGKMAAALTRSVQRHPGCGVTIKHFAANNQETNRYNSNSCVSERALREIYLRGFEIAVREGQPHALMTSYNLLNGVHTSESRELIEGILREEWGYRGIVMTDWVIRGGTEDKTSLHPGPEPWKTAAAGSDLFMPGGKKEYKNILAALKKGTLRRETLQISAARVISLARRLKKVSKED